MTIGITGCGPGSGVTHLALALSNYCSSKLKQKTAFLELHSRNEISHLLPLSRSSSQSDAGSSEPCFQIHGIDYFPSINNEIIPILLNKGYGYLILDLGNIRESSLQEFLRCDKKLVIGSLAPWKTEKYREFFHTFDKSINLGEGFHYLVQTGTNKNILDFSKTYHISMRSVPYISNPFRIEKELFVFMQELLL